jgi:hypothetical protein
VALLTSTGAFAANAPTQSAATANAIATSTQLALMDSLIAMLPMLVILIPIMVIYIFRIRHQGKLGSRMVEQLGDNKLIMERQRMMLDHLGNIEKLLVDISYKMDKK